MKNLFNRTLSVLCAVMLLISAVSAWAAAEEPSTPTDLNPAGEPKSESGEEGIDSVEIIINKTLTVGQSWEGKMKKTKPAVLKLDVTNPGLVYMLVEGKDVWATVEKSDRLTENPARTQTNPETDWMVISWEAMEGSYLITLGPVEPNLLAKATVSFMDKTAYGAWEAEHTEPEAEEEPEAESEVEHGDETGSEPEAETEEGIEPEGTKTEPDKNADEQEEENEPAEETEPVMIEEETEQEEEPAGEPEEEKPEGEPEKEQEGNEPVPAVSAERSIHVEVSWDVPEPVVGDTAHFTAIMKGYEGLQYTIQWQYSIDEDTWFDIPGETEPRMDVLITKAKNLYYWRIVVYLEEEAEID